MMLSFKSKDKLKKEILKELEVEMRKKEEKQKINNSFSSFEKVVLEPKKVNNSPDDLKEIQKKFVILGIVLLILILIFIYLFIYSDYIFGNKSNKNEQVETEVIEKEKVEKTLSELDDGNIDISNSELMDLYSIFNNSIYDYLMFDSTFLYKYDSMLVSKLNTNQLLYLMSKTPEFSNIIDEFGLISEAELCYKDSTISIEKTKLDEILLKRFNRANVNFNQFNVAYYINKQFITYFNFKYNDGAYKSTCFNKKLVDSKIITQSLADKAEKKGDTITIDLKVVFINNNGIYSDITLKNKIKSSNDDIDDVLDYITEGSVYKAIFKENENKEYYFHGMVKAKN